MKIAAKLRLLRPMIEGRKYSARESPKAIRWNIDGEIRSQKVYENRPVDVPQTFHSR